MKEAYYFSHDSNARHDPKMTAMRGTYGAEGYGWFWMLIEMMMESSDYKLDMHSKYTFNAFAMQLQTDAKKMEQFVRDCIQEYELFESDESFFWSESLLRRMEKRKKISESRSKAASKRWNNANASKSDANALQNDEDDDFAMQDDAKESKGKKSKGNEIESSTTTDDFQKVNNAFAKIHKVLDMSPKDWPEVEKLLKKGVTADLIIEVMSEKHAKKVKEGGSVNSFSFYISAINERFEQNQKEVSRLDFLKDL